MNREEKIERIEKEFNDISIYITDIMEYVNNKGWNMVVSNSGMIMFNKAGTKDEDGSYKKIEGYKLTEIIKKQSDECIDFIYSLIE